MSRIGNQNITIPAGVTVNISDDNVVTVKGPKVELSQKVDPCITVTIEENEIKFERESNQKNHRALHGLYRSLVNNMVIGVTEGYKIELELIGVGWKAESQNNVLDLTMGFSHRVFFQLPDEVQVETVSERGKTPAIILKSADKQLVGQVAAKIRSYRKPEPYKGKGIRFKGEVLRRKAGKTAAK